MDILIIGGGLQALSVAHSLKKRGYVVIALLYKGDISTKSNQFYTHRPSFFILKSYFKQ